MLTANITVVCQMLPPIHDETLTELLIKSDQAVADYFDRKVNPNYKFGSTRIEVFQEGNKIDTINRHNEYYRAEDD